jgi:two-component system, cell cycle response regulator
MPAPHAVCLVGFSEFERQALSAHFRLAAHRTPGYLLVDAVESARFLVVDGDARAASERVARERRIGSSIYIGSRAPDGALARLPRPIDALHLLRELDAALLLNLERALDAPAASAPDVASRSAGPRTEPAALYEPSQLSALADLFPDRQQASASAPVAGAEVLEALLVDDSDIALRFLELRLGELGVRTHAVRDSDAALDQLARHSYALVCLDVELGEDSPLDGLTLCQHIKRQPGKAPVVAIVSAHAGATDRVRGSLAGCDAYLAKPLATAELAAVVARLKKSTPTARRRAR